MSPALNVILVETQKKDFYSLLKTVTFLLKSELFVCVVLAKVTGLTRVISMMYRLPCFLTNLVTTRKQACIALSYFLLKKSIKRHLILGVSRRNIPVIFCDVLVILLLWWILLVRTSLGDKSFYFYSPNFEHSWMPWVYYLVAFSTFRWSSRSDIAFILKTLFTFSYHIFLCS